MPPRVKLPHGLTKDPRLMSTAEKGIFGLLAASIGLGVYRLATSPWGEQEKKNSMDKNDAIKNMGSEMNTTVQPTVLEISQDLKPTKSTLAVEDGVTRVETTIEPPSRVVDDGVTDIRFGDAQQRRR
eukprot:CAMPEP_0202482402 /NCGR_PEP_ID=MMETSP1361-20130828/1807_1 /ASSEMBLY_ACC=CAM_ASM_000849 /TAXON_ID=210615 /ORGANISM="Staurosira complex sp., Strain CCMP2646" /LENGTH=126 /DNA_ID=CAMNT_0049110259 /DNA_START=176 /DNA_END=556 /DNA_ORIENTATION=+